MKRAWALLVLAEVASAGHRSVSVQTEAKALRPDKPDLRVQRGPHTAAARVGAFFQGAVVVDKTYLGLHAWSLAFIVSVMGSALTVGGLILQKKGAQVPGEHPRLGDVVFSKTWIIGFLLVALADFPVAMFVYSLAPISLIAPLSGVTVVLNFVVAPHFLQEEVHWWPDLPATGLIAAGIVLTTFVAAHDEAQYDAAALWGRFTDPTFICVMASAAVLVAGCIIHMQRASSDLIEKPKPGTWKIHQMLAPALAAAGAGLFSNINLKAAGILLAAGDGWSVVPWLIITVLPAVLQINYLNRGMQLYPQAVFIPVYSACLMLITTIGGAIFYQDYTYIRSWHSLFMFLGGAGSVAAGICLFAARHNFADADVKTVDG